MGKDKADIQEVPKPKKDNTISLTVVLRSVEGKKLRAVDEEVDEDGEVERKFLDLTVRKAILMSLTQGPDSLKAQNKAPLGDNEKMDCHVLAVAIASRERTGFGFTADDITLIKKLASARLPHAWYCALVEHLDPNKVKHRE